MELSKEQHALFSEIGKKIEHTQEEMWWDNRQGLEDHSKKEIMKKGIYAWFLELEEYNHDYRWEIEDEIRKNILSEYQSEICAAYDIPEDAFVASDYIEEVQDYHPQVYLDPHDVFRGEYLRMRVQLHSNFDCQLSHWLESQGGYVYEATYFGDMVDALNLCPQRMKQALVRQGIKVFGTWRTKKHRHGKEYVDYDTLVTEVQNNVCPSLLTFPVLVYLNDLWECTDYEETVIKRVTIPKGSDCGLFSSFQGGGSMLETPLLREMEINLETSDWALVPDISYSIKETFGVYDDFYTEISIS